ncbi:hypothetical protein CH371_17040 [Leptospira wolffii]|uniref:Uncharacterized protein n=1 Tax=Leptospira wolffii TaxID=409998 RepID=A0A2M9Z7S5_9LEPT|nr:hypothetical protein CH371_17040 [Leptospira wolffii]
MDKCLKNSLGKLFESCKTHVSEMLARFEKFKAACGSDEEKYDLLLPFGYFSINENSSKVYEKNRNRVLRSLHRYRLLS